MKNKLPVVLENLELPIDDKVKKEDNNKSYGFVSFMYLLSIGITAGSILAILLLGK